MFFFFLFSIIREKLSAFDDILLLILFLVITFTIFSLVKSLLLILQAKVDTLVFFFKDSLFNFIKSFFLTNGSSPCKFKIYSTPLIFNFL